MSLMDHPIIRITSQAEYDFFEPQILVGASVEFAGETTEDAVGLLAMNLENIMKQKSQGILVIDPSKELDTTRFDDVMIGTNLQAASAGLLFPNTLVVLIRCKVDESFWWFLGSASAYKRQVFYVPDDVNDSYKKLVDSWK